MSNGVKSPRSGLEEEVGWFTRGLIASTFKRNFGSTSKTAIALEISRVKLIQRMNRLGLNEAWRWRTRERLKPLVRAMREAETWERGRRAAQQVKEEKKRLGL